MTRRMPSSRMYLGGLVVLSLTSAIMGIFTALDSPAIGTLWARAMLDTLNRLLAPIVLIVGGAISLVTYGLSTRQATSAWRSAWTDLKFAWKVYATIALALVLFVGGVAASNVIRYR